ncbi:MAG: SEC-C domain-containing protein [Campylobacterales bacterium]|nr:SEC-C domain-containing protein [Campylobacterales bacterium]
MAKVSPNIPCPCGSHKKYKKCCALYHKGALAPDALALMKSRYSAYATGNAEYIINTTHPENPDYSEERRSWKNDIDLFSKHTEFLGLKIIEFIDGKEEAYVTFEASLSSGMLTEKSRFLKRGNVWLYVDGEIS